MDESKLCRVAVSLREITDQNRDEVLALRVAPHQEDFVSSVADSLQEALDCPEGKPWYRAVYHDEVPVGFVMVSWNVEPDPPIIIGPWFLWKLLIDIDHQHRGYGADTVRSVAELIRTEGGTTLLTSYTEGLGDPWPFYRQLGFRPTGDRDVAGEVILALDLAG